MANPDSIQLVLRSSVDDDPYASSNSQYTRDFQQFQEVAEAQGGKIVPPELAMDSATVQTVMAFAPLAHDAIKYLGLGLVAWLHGRAGRKVEVSGYGIKVKATNAAEAEQLIDKLIAAKAASLDGGGKDSK
jgi:hypothetical protein